MENLHTFVLSVLSAVGVSTAAALAVVWLARNWIGERLRQSIKHEYDQKLVALNAELQARSDTQQALLGASIEREADRLRFATGAIGESHKITIGRKLHAVDLVWGTVLKARENIPGAMTLLDVMTVDEYNEARDHPDFKTMIGDLSVEKMAAMFKDDLGTIERARPYVGEYLWSLFFVYQALVVRVALVIHWSAESEKRLNWYQDEGVQSLVRSAFSSSEMREFENLNVDRFSWLQKKLEQRILAAARDVISGKVIGEQALEQAQVMEAIAEKWNQPQASA